MRDDCIAVALGLPQLRIPRQKELEDHFEVTVIYRHGEVTCPRCGEVTTKKHDRRQQNKQDRRLRDKVLFLTLIKSAVKYSLSRMKFSVPGGGPVTDLGSTWARKHFT